MARSRGWAARKLSEIVYQRLQTLEEEPDMKAVYEAMVDCHGDIQLPSAIALLIASPVDTGNGIVGAVETGIRNCGGIQRRSTGVIDNILQGSHAGEECCLLSDGKRSSCDVLMQQALEGCRVEVEHLLIRSLVGEIGVDAVVDDRLAVLDAHTEGFQAVQRLRGQINERKLLSNPEGNSYSSFVIRHLSFVIPSEARLFTLHPSAA